MPIQSFRHKGLKRLFEDDDTRALSAGSVDKLMYGRRPRCKRNLALMRSGVQVMYSACCCGIEDRWP